MNSQFKHPKFKPKLLIFVIAMLLSISAFTSTALIQAADGSMTDEDAKGSREVIGGPNYDRTGFLFWVCDPKGNCISSVKAITSYGAIVDRNGNALPASNIQLINRDGIMAETLAYGAQWGPPYKDGAGRGAEIKQWLLETDANGHKRAANIIIEQWGADLATKWESREAYLVFEPFYWNHVYKDGVGTGIWWCDTSYGWGLFQQSMGIAETGDPAISKYTNQMYPNCLKMEPCQEIVDMGYTAPPHGGRLTNAEMASQKVGWGIGVVWNDKLTQTTCDEPLQPSPHKPPVESKGTYTIVKSYREKINNTYEDRGTFSTSDLGPQILIENEQEYQVVGWKITNQTNTSIDSISWNPPGTIQSQGTTPTSVVIKDPSTCLYVLLEKITEEIPEPQDYNYLITQSSITRKISLSNPDHQLALPKIQDTIFEWNIEAHKDSCSHPYYCDDDDCETEHESKCEWGKWKVNVLKFSIYNTLKYDYPDILATKDGWNFETQTGDLVKHWYNNGPIIRTSTSKQTYTESNWDYVCVILRGKDKLTNNLF